MATRLYIFISIFQFQVRRLSMRLSHMLIMVPAAHRQLGCRILFRALFPLGLQGFQRRGELLSELLVGVLMRLDEFAGLRRRPYVPLNFFLELLNVALFERFQMPRMKKSFWTAHGIGSCESMVGFSSGWKFYVLPFVRLIR
jgi:hypothetical protein